MISEIKPYHMAIPARDLTSMQSIHWNCLFQYQLHGNLYYYWISHFKGIWRAMTLWEIPSFAAINKNLTSRLRAIISQTGRHCYASCSAYILPRSTTAHGKGTTNTHLKEFRAWFNCTVGWTCNELEVFRRRPPRKHRISHHATPSAYNRMTISTDNRSK